MTSASMPVPARRVDMWYSGTAPQSRVTVVFRIILAIPQFVVLFFLGIAAFVVTVIGWFAALVTESSQSSHTPSWVVSSAGRSASPRTCTS